MEKYRKKPVVVEAVQYTVKNGMDIVNWMCDVSVVNRDANDDLRIQTSEGELKASTSDWVIKGIKGEFYPCKPDIFAATYEKVDTHNEPQEV